jgi:tocopherol O-methyltransferase
MESAPLMIDCPTVTKTVIRGHYDLSTLFYRLLWGPHIHHGLWTSDESPRVAQLQLTERLADFARVRSGTEMVDIGCGMGASSIHLAKTRGSRSLGVTISPLQRRWAQAAALLQGVGGATRFQCTDAEALQLAANSVDVVWSVECTEHLFDKASFFQRTAQWLRPGGRIAICAWLAGDRANTEQGRQLVYDVCEGFFCPSLGASEDYVRWFEQAGLVMERNEDWTSRVLKTWEICRQRVDRTGVRWLARLVDRDTVMFLDRFQTILDAYRTGAMAYGCFVARKPG